MANDLGSGYQLAFEEAKRAVVQQAGAVEALRGRAGTLLAVASLATSFLGGLALQDKAPRGWLSWVAVAAFVGVVVLAVLILLPSYKWVFALSARRIIGDYIEGEPPADLAATHRDLALHLENHLDRNEKRLDWLYRQFTAASALLVVEVLAWLVILWRAK